MEEVVFSRTPFRSTYNAAAFALFFPSTDPQTSGASAKMAMDAIALAELVYQIGDALATRCQEVKECESEVKRVKNRILRIMGQIETASGVFSRTHAFVAILEELKQTFNEADGLLKVQKQ